MKHSTESLINTMKWVENKSIGIKEKVEKSDNSDKTKNTIKIWMERARPLGHHQET
jgi:hypothetical protein